MTSRSPACSVYYRTPSNYNCNFINEAEKMETNWSPYYRTIPTYGLSIYYLIGILKRYLAIGLAYYDETLAIEDTFSVHRFMTSSASPPVEETPTPRSDLKKTMA